MPLCIKAKFEIVTPMFLGDANSGQCADTIRPPSIKGALRFWWRLLQWPFCQNLASMHRCEGNLFGRAANDPSSGQSSFLIDVENNYTFRKQGEKLFKNGREGIGYLGYGVTLREYILENQQFIVNFRSRIPLNCGIINAIKAFGLIGGLGSRARRGFGSCALLELQDGRTGESLWQAPTTMSDYQAQIRAVFQPAFAQAVNKSMPPFTAIGPESRMDCLTEPLNDARTVLGQLGRAMVQYRSWGKDGKVLGEPSERNFPEDHDWLYSQPTKAFHPRRAVFGLPHNYYGSKNHVKCDVIAEHHERRASPLLLHVHKVGDRYVGMSFLLPAEFLPKGERIKAGGSYVPAYPDWEVLTDFLDDPKRFPHRDAVLGTLP